MIKGDMRGSYCVYSWKDDGSDTKLESKHEFKTDAFAAADKWNKEHERSGRTSDIIPLKGDGAMLEQIINILMEMDPEKLRVVLAFLRAYQ